MLSVQSDGPVLRLTLSRPEVRNALNAPLIAGLKNQFDSLSAEVRVVILSGEGGAFCAGGDLNWMREAAGYTEEENYRDALALASLFQSIAGSRAIVISAVNGDAFGGGCGLVAAADVAIATENARFAFSEVKLGLVPATISPYVLAKIGSGHARALFTTGEVFGAERALTIGLIHQIGLDQVERIVQSILAAGPKATAEAKRLAQEVPGGPEDSARLLSAVRAGEEAKEGISAFLEKRRPSFFAELRARQ